MSHHSDHQSPLERLTRHALRNSTPAGFARLTLTSLGIFTTLALFWDHMYTIQLSEGPSMYPTFNPRGDYMLISRRYRYGRGVKVGDVVRFYHPSFVGVHGAKRVLGLPGDFVCRDPALGKGVGGARGPGGEGEMVQVFTYFLTSWPS